MTTLSFRGYRIIDRAGTADDSFSRVTVNLAVNPGYKLGYSVTGTEAGVHSIALNTSAGSLYSLEVNDVPLAAGYEIFMVYPTLNGKTSTFLVIARDMTETTDDTTDLEMTYLQIGGSAAPSFRSLSSFSTWFQARDLLATPPTGATGPGKQIDLTKSSAFTSTSQTDHFQLLPDWGGGLVVAGVMDDVVAGNDLSNLINLGAGNDRGDGAMGNDTILGDIGNDRMLGGRGNDNLQGGDGRDTLVGGWGNDTLTGGSGSDRFIFDDIRGSDVITDFEDGIDRIDLRSFGFTPTEISAVMTQVGSAVEIELADGNILTVNNMTVAALQNDLIL